MRLGTLGKLHTKHWFALSSGMQHLFGVPVVRLRLGPTTDWAGGGGVRSSGGRLPGGPEGDGGAAVASAICLGTLGGRPWGPAGAVFLNLLLQGSLRCNVS